MKVEMKDLQDALDVLRRVENFERDAAPGELGKLRAKAFCTRVAIEVSIGAAEVEVES